MISKVCVLGSINMDVVVRVDRFPQVGETITGLTCELMPGSNALLQRETIDEYLDRQSSAIRYLISQFEVPLDLVSYTFGKAKSLGITTILNPSPMQPISRELMEQTDMLVLNELELAQVIGLTHSISSPDEVAQAALRWRQEIGKKTVDL